MADTDLLSSSEAVRDREPTKPQEQESGPAESPLARVAKAALPKWRTTALPALLGSRERMAQTRERHAAELAPLISDVDESTRTRETNAARRPTPIDTAPPPSRKLTEFLAPVQGESPEASVTKMVTGLGLFAQMIGSIARGHARTGLAAWTGALQGWQLGDHERAETAFADWKANTDKALKDYTAQRDAINDLLHDNTRTIEERMRRAEMKAWEHGHTEAAEALRAGSIEKYIDVSAKADEAAARLESERGRIEESRRAHKETERHHRAQEQKWAEDSAVNAAGGGYTPETLQRLASRYRAGEPIRDLVRGFGKLATNAMIEIQNIAEQQALADGDTPGAIRLRKANLDANRAALTKLSKDESDFNSFLSSFEFQLKNTRSIVEAAKTSGSPIWNAPTLWYRNAVKGDPTAKNLLAQMEILANEMSRITLRTRGTAEGTRQHHRDLLNGSMTLEQFDSLAQQVMTMDANAARRGFAEQKRVLQQSIEGPGPAAATTPAPTTAPGTPQRMRAAEYNGVSRTIPADTNLSQFPGAKWISP